jgi:chromate transport protein ChrA
MDTIQKILGQIGGFLLFLLPTVIIGLMIGAIVGLFNGKISADMTTGAKYGVIVGVLLFVFATIKKAMRG